MKKPNELKRPSEETLLNLLKDIENGKITVLLDRKESKDAIESENGVYHFDTSNKWRVGVHVDCGNFDYLQYISHGGTEIDFYKLGKFYPTVDQYADKFRNKDLAKKVWGIEAEIFADV